MRKRGREREREGEREKERKGNDLIAVHFRSSVKELEERKWTEERKNSREREF